jgi:hypothetical protein
LLEGLGVYQHSINAYGAVDSNPYRKQDLPLEPTLGAYPKSKPIEISLSISYPYARVYSKLANIMHRRVLNAAYAIPSKGLAVCILLVYAE